MLLVLDEEDNSPLLVHRVSCEDIYVRQGGASGAAGWAACGCQGAAAGQWRAGLSCGRELVAGRRPHRRSP